MGMGFIIIIKWNVDDGDDGGKKEIKKSGEDEEETHIRRSIMAWLGQEREKKDTWERWDVNKGDDNVAKVIVLAGCGC